jgi:hypothetical protein
VLTQLLEPFQYLHKLIVQAIVLSGSPYVFSVQASNAIGYLVEFRIVRHGDNLQCWASAG